jgi:hypothetical protein
MRKANATEQLGRALEDLASAQCKANELASAETNARASAETYATWRAERAAAEVEIERLTFLVADLEQPAAQERELNALEAVRNEHAKKRKANAALAVRIRNDLAKANEILLALVRDVATSTYEDLQLNSQLPADLDPIVGADHLARGRPGIPQKEIGREPVWMWTKVADGFIPGDQDAVEDRGDGKGMLRSGLSSFPCMRTLFEQVTYDEEESPERAQPLWHMKIPCSDAPGFAFDGSRFTDPRAVIAALDAPAKAVTKRLVKVELIPLPSVSGAADADASAEGAN